MEKSAETNKYAQNVQVTTKQIIVKVPKQNALTVFLVTIHMIQT